MSALHPIFDRLGRDFERLLSPAPAEPEPDAEPVDPGAAAVICMLCLAQAALGYVFWTGERFPAAWIAIAAIGVGALFAFWPRTRA
jgi:hypothetical protein